VKLLDAGVKVVPTLTITGFIKGVVLSTPLTSSDVFTEFAHPATIHMATDVIVAVVIIHFSDIATGPFFGVKTRGSV
jgi:hypothetical protein